MGNPFEVLIERIEQRLFEMETRLADKIAKENEQSRGVDLDRYISLRKVADMYGLYPQTLCAHKHEIQHIKRFNQIFFLKESLSDYMEGGRPVIEMKKVMRTKRGRAATV